MRHLFSPNIEPKDEDYRSLRDDGRYSEQRDFAEYLWQKYEPYADRQFLAAIASEFHPRFWEMYLGCAILKQNITLVSSGNKKRGGPDLCFSRDQDSVWIEAIAPTPGSGVDAVPQLSLSGQAFTVPDVNITLRYTAAISEKSRKYDGYLEKCILTSSDSYIIAVNGQNVYPILLEDEVPRIVKAVLSLGSPSITLNPDTFEIVDQGYAHRPVLWKAKGSQVPTDTFFDPAFSGISGLIFSMADVWTGSRVLGSDFFYVHNPLAANPLPKGWLPIGIEYWVEDDKLRSCNWNEA